MTTCPHCGGHLYRDPDERVLRCLMCAREFVPAARKLTALERKAPSGLSRERRSA